MKRLKHSQGKLNNLFLFFKVNIRTELPTFFPTLKHEKSKNQLCFKKLIHCAHKHRIREIKLSNFLLGYN